MMQWILANVPPEGIGLVVTLFLSLMIGFQLEERRETKPTFFFGGARTYPLIAISGFLLTVVAPGDYIPFTAGLLVRNVLRNAALPAMTIAGVLLGELIGGAVVTETVFARFGIGRLTADALNAQDTPVLQAIVIIAAAVFVVVNLAVDLLAPVLDPRLRRRVQA